MRKTIAAFAVACLALTSGAATAKVLPLKELGVSVEIPDDWVASSGEEKGRTFAFLKPAKDSSSSVVLRCRIDRHELPERFRHYTQERINVLRAEKPFTASDFAQQLTQANGVPTTVLENGEAMLDRSRGSWALTTSSEVVGSTTAYYMSKVYLTQTPGFAWNLQCASASTSSRASAAEAYKAGRSTFDKFFSSFRYIG